MMISNKRARFDYEITDVFEAGVMLTGPEVKSLRSGNARLDGSFVRIIGSEPYLVNAQIFPYRYAPSQEYNPTRTRKLLLHRRELTSIMSRMKGANLTLIPVRWYTRGPLLKLEIALARGRKQYEKREKKRKEEQKLELEREFRGKVK